MLTTREFLTAIWPPTGPYCIARPWTPKGAPKPTYAHSGFDDLDGAIQYIMQRRSTDDIYFAVHALKVRSQLNPATGKPKVYRTHENMREAKAFFFDLDVGTEAGKYPTQADALIGLQRFLFDVPLHDPIVTSSGGGLHVYWTLSDPIPSEEWRETADKLHWLALRHHLKVDPQRTTDQSSVLRVANTFNRKIAGNPRKVEVLATGAPMDTSTFVNLLNQLTGTEYVPVGYLAPAIGSEGFASPVEWDGRVTPLDELVDTCEYIREFRDKQGCVPEPFWHSVLGVLKYGENGEQTAHEWSSGFPKYSAAETQSKLDLWKTGPSSCTKLATACGGDACTRCPLKDTAKNPLAIANKAWEQRNAPAPALSFVVQTKLGKVDTLVEPGYPYQRTPAGIIRKLKDDDETDPTKKRKFVRILDYNMFPVHQYDGNEATPGFSLWAVDLPLAGQRIIEIPNSVFDPRSLHQTLLDAGVIIDGKMTNEVRDFMLAYLKTLQRQTMAKKQYDYLGWEVPENPDDAPPSFILYGKKLAIDTGEIITCAMSRNMQGAKEFMCRAGSLQKQIDLLDFYNHPNYIPHQFAIIASAATPAFRFTDQHGVIINLSGETGVSKSTALYTAAAIWGHPKLYPLSGLEGGATKNAREDRAMMLANLPLMVDEITLMPPEEARNFVLSRSQPGGKRRLDQHGNPKPTRAGIKSNITICSANSSLHQLINTSNVAGQAGSVRVFEIALKRNRLVHKKFEADIFLRNLGRNYGWIGEELWSQLLPNMDVIERRIAKEMARIEAMLKIDPSERFWSSVCATVLVIGKLMRKLGFHNYDMQAMEDWIINEQFPIMRGHVSQELQRRDPISILGDYIKSIHGETVRIELDNQGQVSGIIKVPETDLKAHHDITNGEIWLRREPFRRHCEREGHPLDTVLKTLVADGVVKDANVRKEIGRGTSGSTGRVFCIVVDLKHTEIAATVVATAMSEPADDPVNVVRFQPKGVKK